MKGRGGPQKCLLKLIRPPYKCQHWSQWSRYFCTQDLRATHPHSGIHTCTHTARERLTPSVLVTEGSDVAVRAWRLLCCWLSNVLFFKQSDNTTHVQKDIRRHKTAKLNTSYWRSKTVEETRSRYSLTASLSFGKKKNKKKQKTKPTGASLDSGCI